MFVGVRFLKRIASFASMFLLIILSGIVVLILVH